MINFVVNDAINYLMDVHHVCVVRLKPEPTFLGFRIFNWFFWSV